MGLNGIKVGNYTYERFRQILYFIPYYDFMIYKIDVLYLRCFLPSINKGKYTKHLLNPKSQYNSNLTRCVRVYTSFNVSYHRFSEKLHK